MHFIKYEIWFYACQMGNTQKEKLFSVKKINKTY